MHYLEQLESTYVAYNWADAVIVAICAELSNPFVTATIRNEFESDRQDMDDQQETAWHGNAHDSVDDERHAVRIVPNAYAIDVA